MKRRIEQYFNNYDYYYKDFSDGKFYKVTAFDVDSISNRIVRIGFKNADFRLGCIFPTEAQIKYKS